MVMRYGIPVLLLTIGISLGAQEEKPVPKDSMRVTVIGCAKGAAFTAGPRTEAQVGRADIPEGTRLRMNASKKLRGEIKAHEGEMVRIVESRPLSKHKRWSLKEVIRAATTGV